MFQMKREKTLWMDKWNMIEGKVTKTNTQHKMLTGKGRLEEWIKWYHRDPTIALLWKNNWEIEYRENLHRLIF